MCQFPLFETLALIDGQWRNLNYHQERINRAFAEYFKSKINLTLADIRIPTEYKTGFYRCRIDYNPREYRITFSKYSPRELHTFQCVQVENLDYRFKYSDRSQLDQLKIAQIDEIIIINNGFISDCTIGNLLFLKQGRWFSPTHYLLKGTQLSYLLDQKQIELVEIRADDLFKYEKMMVINALNPFDPSRAVSINSQHLFCDFCNTAQKCEKNA